MDIMAGLTAVGQALSIVKQLRDIEKSTDEAGWKLALAEMQGALADAKLALVEAQEKSNDQDQEITRLKAQFRRREETVEIKGFRYSLGEHGEPVGLPYCPRCMEVDGLLMRLADATGRHGRTHVCPQCKADYPGAAEYLPRKV